MQLKKMDGYLLISLLLTPKQSYLRLLSVGLSLDKSAHLLKEKSSLMMHSFWCSQQKKSSHLRLLSKVDSMLSYGSTSIAMSA
jgi:hypothetical protein